MPSPCILHMCREEEKQGGSNPDDPRQAGQQYPFARQTQSNPGDEWRCDPRTGHLADSSLRFSTLTHAWSMPALSLVGLLCESISLDCSPERMCTSRPVVHSAEWTPSQTMAQMTMRVTAGSRARRGMLEAVCKAHAVIIGTAASTLHRNGLSCLRSCIRTSAVPAEKH